MRRRTLLQLAAASSQARAAYPADSDGSRLVASDAPLPEWARSGNFVFMGLDGGPLESEKGMRSGWPGFTRDDPQGIVQAMREFYRPENVDIPRTGGANWVYLTWSNGWSKIRERQDQWPHAARFMKECRKHGIHVSAYISAANLFWEDYLEKVPESRKWIETTDPTLVRHYGGSMYRVMANIRLPAWRDQIKQAIDAALDAGVEGFWVDNLFWWHGESLFADFVSEMRAHGARRRSNLVWHVNVNTGVCNWGRAGNVVGTEDGKAPKLLPGNDPPVAGNLGLLSFISGLREGWRPAIMEHYGNDLSPSQRQLIIAESWMWQVHATWFPDSYLLPARWHWRDPAAWRILEAMGSYHRHFLRWQEYFRDGAPVATVGIVGHTGSTGSDTATQEKTARAQRRFIQLLDLLAASNVQFEVLFDDRLRRNILRHYPLVVVADADSTPTGGWEALGDHLREGGRIIAVEGAPLPKSTNHILLPQNAFQPGGMWRLLRNEIIQRSPQPAVVANPPATIIYRAIGQPERTIVHLVNYSMQPCPPFRLRNRAAVRKVEMLLPESGSPRQLTFAREGPWTVISVPEFPIHCLLAFA